MLYVFCSAPQDLYTDFDVLNQWNSPRIVSRRYVLCFVCVSADSRQSQAGLCLPSCQT